GSCDRRSSPGVDPALPAGLAGDTVAAIGEPSDGAAAAAPGAGDHEGAGAAAGRISPAAAGVGKCGSARAPGFKPESISRLRRNSDSVSLSLMRVSFAFFPNTIVRAEPPPRFTSATIPK